MVRRGAGVFRVLRDEPSVFEFEFEFVISVPGGDPQDVLVFVSCPLLVEDLMLPGTDIRVTKSDDGTQIDLPAGWIEDKERKFLARIIDDLFQAHDVPDVEDPGVKSDPRQEEVAAKLDLLAAEAAQIMATRAMELGADHPVDLLYLHHHFQKLILDRMFEIQKENSHG